MERPLTFAKLTHDMRRDGGRPLLSDPWAMERAWNRLAESIADKPELIFEGGSGVIALLRKETYRSKRPWAVEYLAYRVIKAPAGDLREGVPLPDIAVTTVRVLNLNFTAALKNPRSWSSFHSARKAGRKARRAFSSEDHDTYVREIERVRHHYEKLGVTFWMPPPPRPRDFEEDDYDGPP